MKREFSKMTKRNEINTLYQDVNFKQINKPFRNEEIEQIF